MDVDLRSDLRQLPHPDNVFDLIVASHVLEHVDRDGDAIRELSRVLRPDGTLFVAVPVVADMTVEYGAPNSFEDHHWRAPGRDYYDRLGPWFDDVRIFDSEWCDPATQPYHIENRRCFPNKRAPLRPPQTGERHPEVVALASKPRVR
jgi:SAM-dependent methyltransferase